MATYTVVNHSGNRVGEVIFSYFPPDTNANVYSESMQKIGYIKSRHAIGDGVIFNIYNNMVGEVFGNSLHKEPCIVQNSMEYVLGVIINASGIMKDDEFDPTKRIQVGTIQIKSWTSSDIEGVKQVAEATGRDSSDDHFIQLLIKRIIIKQSNLVGAAALALIFR